MILKKIEELLFENQDIKYKEFHSKLIPNISPDRIIGVRTPIIRSLAKELQNKDDIDLFLNDLPHKYYDENNLHGLIICNFKDYVKTIEYLDKFLPYVDNWATCDLLRPKIFKKNRLKLKEDIIRWLYSEHTYEKRFGIEMVMTHFLDDEFDAKLTSEISEIRSDEYYIKMMIAWYFSTALAKQWNNIIPYFEAQKLDYWTHNKAIQKSIESYRITDDRKKYLLSLKVNNNKQ